MIRPSPDARRAAAVRVRVRLLRPDEAVPLLPGGVLLPRRCVGRGLPGQHRLGRRRWRHRGVPRARGLLRRAGDDGDGVPRRELLPGGVGGAGGVPGQHGQPGAVERHHRVPGVYNIV